MGQTIERTRVHDGRPLPGGLLEAALLDAVPEAMIVFDDKDRIARVNDAFCAWTGFTPDDLLGAGRPFPHWAEDERTRGELRFEHIRELGGGQFEMTVNTADGRALEALASVSAAYDPSGRFIGCVATYRDRCPARFEARLERALREVAQAKLTGPDGERELAHLVAERVCELLGAAPQTAARDGPFTPTSGRLLCYCKRSGFGAS